MYIATLVDIKEINRLPDKIKPYVEFKAQIENRELKNEKVAIFNIATTAAYIPVFLDNKSLKEIEDEIAKEANAKISIESKETLRRFLKFNPRNP